MQTVQKTGDLPQHFPPYEVSFFMRNLSYKADPVDIACTDVLVFGSKDCARIENSNSLKFFQLVGVGVIIESSHRPRVLDRTPFVVCSPIPPRFMLDRSAKPGPQVEPLPDARNITDR